MAVDQEGRKEDSVFLIYALYVKIVGFSSKKHIIMHGMNIIKVLKRELAL
jgi:hypothetical protein